MSQRGRERPEVAVRRLRWSFVGLALMTAMLFVNLFSRQATGTPLWLTLLGVWGVLMLLCLAWWRHARLVVALAVLDFAVWLAVALAVN